MTNTYDMLPKKKKKSFEQCECKNLTLKLTDKDKWIFFYTNSCWIKVFGEIKDWLPVPIICFE